MDINRLYYISGWSLLGLLLLLLVLEGWRYGVKPSKSNNKQHIERSLSKASRYFLNKQRELLNNTEELASTLQRPLTQQQSPQYSHRILSQYPQFWGTTLYREGQPVIWNGFAFQDNRSGNRLAQEKSSVSLKKHNNVIFWEFHVPLTIQDSAGTVSYDLRTSYRIQQSNPLPIGDRNEFHLLESQELSLSYPLNFSVFSSPPEDYVRLAQLSNLRGDSVGVVYATADKFQQKKQQWTQSTRFWRSVFALFCFIILTFPLFWVADKLSLWPGLLIQLTIIGIGWSIVAYTNLLSYWIITLADLAESSITTTITSLSTTFINALFALAASIIIARRLKTFNPRVNSEGYFSSIDLGISTGLLNVFGILYVFHLLYQASAASNVPLLDLRILPEWSTIGLYLSLGMAVLALGILLIAINRLLFRCTANHLKLIAPVLGISFVIGLLGARLLLPLDLALDRMLYISILAFVIVMGISVAYYQEQSWMTEMSILRKVVIGSFVIAALCIPVINQASLTSTDENLWKTAQNFSQEKDPFAEQITTQLLTQLEQQFRSISARDLQNDRGALQARFTETIRGLLSPKWNTYSFDLQLINPSGELIADYSTDLNSPNWTNVYNIPALKLVTNIEQITKSTIRPIVQLPQLINQEDYRTFYRGWIPVFGSSENKAVAWILCSVYRERPEFNKPIRAVMASLSYEDWNTTYLMQKFQNGRMTQSAQRGFTDYFPKKRTLKEQELKALQEDSLIYITNNSSEYNYRTLLWKTGDEEIIKVSTTLADYRVILFSFFRFSFILLLAGCLVVLLAQLFSGGKVSFMDKDKRFQDRILDSFLLATLVFLAILIASSHYTIKQQNRDIVRQELFDKLESLSRAMEENQNRPSKTRLSRSFSLDTLTIPLNVDASFYDKRTISETTTPQIYQQHLLPSVLPYDIYNRLYVEQQQDAFSTVNLAGQSLLIGYRSIYNENNQPLGTIAIPTFLESPKYDQQLLETTSYLILIYMLVFGLFIIGSTAISKKLTRPLIYIQRGLNKISAGNLDTTIPVKSRDEIGNLAKAYNNMVSRLKKLQKELAVAEREAAWKEMAQQVAHEIKNPLTPMKLNVQHLERQLKSDNQDPEKLKKQVRKITNNLIEQIQSLNNIASDFSKFSQPLEEDFKQVNLVGTLSSVANLYEHDEKVKVVFNTPNRSIRVQGIEDELKRVLINLVKNAYEAMPDGGEINLRLYQKQQNVFVEIEDDGVGIPEEDRSNIFVPNFSTKSSGTGLGLAICKKIIEAHEGSISFASVEEEGTTFVVKLPQA